MKDLIIKLEKENDQILKRTPELSIEFDWSGDAFKLQFNKDMIDKLKLLLIQHVVNRREL